MTNRDENAPEGTDVRLFSAVPTFLVADVGGTARWYREQLGLEASFFPDLEPRAYASFGRDGVEIMLLHMDGYEKPDITALRPEGLWDAYIRMQRIHAFYESLSGRDSIKMSLTKQFYGDSEFEVRDPNGYVLVVSELID